MEPSGELWLIRHGETEWSASGAHTSRTDLPLTAEGERRAAQLKPVLEGHPFALVLSSPMRRALDTCRLAGLAGRVQITTDLCEWNYGDYEGRTTPAIQKDAPGWTIWTNTPPGGETATEVAARADRVIARALTASPAHSTGEYEGGEAARDVALFGHGHMLRVLAARWLGLDPVAGKFFALSTGSVSVLGYEHGVRVIRLWNRTADLA